MDAEITLTRVSPARTADRRSSASEGVWHTSAPTHTQGKPINRADLQIAPRAITDTSRPDASGEAQLTVQAYNLQDHNSTKNSEDWALAQLVDATEQISVCPGSRGRWRVVLQIPLLLPVALILGVILGITTCPLFQLILMVPVLLILSPVSFAALAFQGFRLPYRYSPLRNPREIRLIQVQPGPRSDKVRFALIEGSLDSSSYEALSYAWGGMRSLMEVDRRTFEATLSLRQALTHLRAVQSTRTVWVDALCINQKNDQEKSEQVQQMQEIYAKARRVIVWLGADPGDIATAFQQVSVLANASTEELPNILNTPGRWKESLKKILRCSWWERIWVIQEVVVAQEVIMQCGDHTIAWDDISLSLLRPEVRTDLEIPYGVYTFVKRVNYLRKTRIDPKYGLLSLVYDFRHKRSTVPHDKIYALRGLIKTAEHTPTAQVDYSLKPQHLWQSFAKQYINHHGSLFILALVDRYDYGQARAEQSSWCIDWSRTAAYESRLAEESRQPLWDGGLNDQDCYVLSSKYRAAGGVPALCRTNLADPDVISVKGFVYDTVAAVGISGPTSKSPNIDCWNIFEQWEAFAGGPWTGDDIYLQNTFNATLTAGNWTTQPNDWRYWTSKEQEGRLEEHLEYNRIRTAACTGRRLFITKNGSVGLGHSDVRAGDTICILLGANVPFILRKQNHPSPRSLSPHYFFCKRWKHIQCCIPILFKIVGQAYIHSIMRYEGSVINDIKTKKIVLEEFFIE